MVIVTHKTMIQRNHLSSVEDVIKSINIKHNKLHNIGEPKIVEYEFGEEEIPTDMIEQVETEKQDDEAALIAEYIAEVVIFFLNLKKISYMMIQM
jgi:hypothetical protein